MKTPVKAGKRFRRMRNKAGFCPLCGSSCTGTGSPSCRKARAAFAPERASKAPAKRDQRPFMERVQAVLKAHGIERPTTIVDDGAVTSSTTKPQKPAPRRRKGGGGQ